MDSSGLREACVFSGKRLDYWSSPDETVAKRAGDCEDFAILKMASLLQTGIPQEKMAI